MKNRLIILTAAIVASTTLNAIDTLALPSGPEISSGIVLKTVNNTMTSSNSKIITFIKGWNMVSIPGYDTVNISEVFSDSTYVYNVYYYSASTGSYLTYNPAEVSNTYTTIDPSQGFWVYAYEPFQLVFNTSIPATVSGVTTTSVNEAQLQAESQDRTETQRPETEDRTETQDRTETEDRAIDTEVSTSTELETQSTEGTTIDSSSSSIENNYSTYTPSRSSCVAIDGSFNPWGDSECLINNSGANTICSGTLYRLPTYEDISEIITKCGGVIGASSVNYSNKKYQNCYKALGFSSKHNYWLEGSQYVRFAFGSIKASNNSNDLIAVKCHTDN